jgi:hypothetical protein
MSFTGDTVLYPLAVGNKWTYQMTDGNTYINSVTGVDPANPSLFSMHNSMSNMSSYMRKEADTYLTNAYDASAFHFYLKDDPAVGESWAVKYSANGIDTEMTMTVTAVGISKDVAGRAFNNVTVVRGDSRFSMNGTPLPTTFTTEYYFAKGVGLVMTASTGGDVHSLVACELN